MIRDLAQEYVALERQLIEKARRIQMRERED